MSIRGFRIDGSTVWILLTRGKESAIDIVDMELGNLNWHAHFAFGNWYARSETAGRTVLLHREIAERSGLNTEGSLIDHRDGDGLNNRRDNLRLATKSKNGQNGKRRPNNTSGVKGVHWLSRTRKWIAQIGVENRRLHLGCFDSIEAASSAYAEAAVKYHGEFSRIA